MVGCDYRWNCWVFDRTGNSSLPQPRSAHFRRATAGPRRSRIPLSTRRLSLMDSGSRLNRTFTQNVPTKATARPSYLQPTKASAAKVRGRRRNANNSTPQADRRTSRRFWTIPEELARARPTWSAPFVDYDTPFRRPPSDVEDEDEGEAAPRRRHWDIPQQQSGLSGAARWSQLGYCDDDNDDQ